jgi:hypothetical protein
VVNIASNHGFDSANDKRTPSTEGLSGQKITDITKSCGVDMVNEQLTQSATPVSSDVKVVHEDATDKPESKTEVPNARILRRTEYPSYMPAKNTKKVREALEIADIAGVNGQVRQQYAIRKRNEAAYAIAEMTLQEKQGVESKAVNRVQESPEITIKQTEKSPEIVELSLIIEKYNQAWLMLNVLCCACNASSFSLIALSST